MISSYSGIGGRLNIEECFVSLGFAMACSLGNEPSVKCTETCEESLVRLAVFDRELSTLFKANFVQGSKTCDHYSVKYIGYCVRPAVMDFM